MGLMMDIIAGAGAIVGAAVVKVLADDAKEWAPWAMRRLLDLAVRRLPEGMRERYAEEWAAHLADIPGVVGKLAVAVQFQIAAQGALEADAKERLAAWVRERDTALQRIGRLVHEPDDYVRAHEKGKIPLDEAWQIMQGNMHAVQSALIALQQQHPRPKLGLTMVAGFFAYREARASWGATPRMRSASSDDSPTPAACGPAAARNPHPEPHDRHRAAALR